MYKQSRCDRKISPYQEALKDIWKTDWYESQFQPWNPDFGSQILTVWVFCARRVCEELPVSNMQENPTFCSHLQVPN